MTSLFSIFLRPCPNLVQVRSYANNTRLSSFYLQYCSVWILWCTVFLSRSWMERCLFLSTWFWKNSWFLIIAYSWNRWTHMRTAWRTTYIISWAIYVTALQVQYPSCSGTKCWNHSNVRSPWSRSQNWCYSKHTVGSMFGRNQERMKGSR